MEKLLMKSSTKSLVHVERLRPEEQEEYANVVRLSECGMYSHSLRWVNVLQRFTAAEADFLVAKVKGKIVGVLPSLMKKNAKYGNVLNSLPFFGTHGGPLVLPTLTTNERLQVKKNLLLAFKELAKERSCVFSTLITTPFEPDASFIRECLKPSFVEPRITQMIVFRKEVDDVETEILYNTIEKRCRNAIRKVQKNKIEVEIGRDLRHVGSLCRMHRTGMMRKHGIAKPARFFKTLFDEYRSLQNKDFKLFFAWKDKKIIAGLLLLYFKNIVEYFTPAFELEYSNLQANTLLIYEAMKDALRNGFNVWNFGGGGRLSGVYGFKRSWGAKDYPYQYLTNAYSDTGEIQSLQEEEILSEYRWFYVIPFTELRRKTS
jgi:hypothetical protein